MFGKAHRILYHFNLNRGKPCLEMDFDRINLKELNFIEAETRLAIGAEPALLLDYRETG